MKIGKDQNIITLEHEIDATANPVLAIYNKGDPEKNPDSYPMMLMQVPREKIFSMEPRKQEQHGVPTFYSILFNDGKSKLALWPIPDQEYHALFEFNPPRRRI